MTRLASAPADAGCRRRRAQAGNGSAGPPHGPGSGRSRSGHDPVISTRLPRTGARAARPAPPSAPAQ
ncbi:hypothetical protein HBB16_18745 [Pseudonocardia sp. MCCB 268]|nr:hypothetical protein [Pseudonocardia cytotoxica]